MASRLSRLVRRFPAAFWALAFLVTIVSVGAAAPVGAPWSINVQPVLLRLDTAPDGHQRARAFGLDVNVHLFTLHAHVGWRGIPLSLPSASGSRP
jgi:hypothetical protein